MPQPSDWLTKQRQAQKRARRLGLSTLRPALCTCCRARAAIVTVHSGAYCGECRLREVTGVDPHTTQDLDQAKRIILGLTQIVNTTVPRVTELERETNAQRGLIEVLRKQVRG